MSFKTIVTLLLLSCLSETGTALGLTERPPQEGGVQAAPTIISLVIKKVHWLMEETSTTVQVCAADDLPAGALKLVYNYGIDGSSTTTTDGVVGSDPRCAVFTKDVKYIIDENPARYELIVTDTSDPIGLIGRGRTTFVITVITTLLTCGGSHITKVTWSGSEKLYADFQCIPGSKDSDKACYHDGDMTGTELCFVVTAEKDMEINVCLNGPIDNSPHSKGPINSNYFYYGAAAASNNNEPAEATLSLAVRILGLTNMRAIVREAGDLQRPEATPWAQVYGCSTVDCTIPAYERKLATYEVCLDAMGDSLATLKTATTTFTDLNLYAFDGDFQKSLLLECVFANGLLDMKYTANLLDKLPEVVVDVVTLSTSHIDCTGVSPDHACFGYLDADSVTGTVLYVTVSADTDSFNTIIVPFTMP